MAEKIKYAVHVLCNECGQVHPMSIAIGLYDGPVDKASIGDTYAGKDLPPELARLIGNEVSCPTTGKMTAQKDNNQVFLVAMKS